MNNFTMVDMNYARVSTDICTKVEKHSVYLCICMHACVLMWTFSALANDEQQPDVPGSAVLQ